MLERNESAETFFEAATTYEPKSILAWTLFGKLNQPLDSSASYR